MGVGGGASGVFGELLQPPSKDSTSIVVNARDLRLLIAMAQVLATG